MVLILKYLKFNIKKAYLKAKSDYDKEHVTTYIKSSIN